MIKFQPTLPLRGATGSLVHAAEPIGISTHAPLAGSDLGKEVAAGGNVISTHAPLAGSDRNILYPKYRAPNI